LLPDLFNYDINWWILCDWWPVIYLFGFANWHSQSWIYWLLYLLLKQDVLKI